MKPCLFLLFILLAISPQTRAGRGNARSSISGHVTTLSGKTLDSVVVKLAADGGWQFSVLADSKGYFSITGLSARTYVATLSRRGYESRRIIEIGIDSGKVAHLALDAALRPLHQKDARITTIVYKLRTTAPIDPGYRTARKPLPGGWNPDEKRKFASAATTGFLSDTALPVKSPAASGNQPPSPNGISGCFARSGSTKIIIDDVQQVSPSEATTTGAVNENELKPAPGTAAGNKRLIDAASNGRSLSSGEINDFSKWNLWEDLSYKQLQEYQKAWPVYPEKRVSVLVKAANGAPLANADVALLELGRPIWEGRTDNTGKAELWFEMFTKEHAFESWLSLRVRVGSAEQIINSVKQFSEGINVVRTVFPCTNSRKVDVAFIVDATGSMGDEISYLKAELGNILQRVTDSMPQAHLQTGAVFYRDRGDEFLVRSSSLTDSFGLTDAFIAEQIAAGGGDGPEAVESALAAGLELGWRDDATARLAFMLLDAPPHDDSITFQKMQVLIRAYAARGIRLIPVACSGSDKPTEYLLRSIALAANGTFLHLSDQRSGTDTAAAAKSIDAADLNELISRTIRSFSAMPECEAELMAAADSTGSTLDKAASWQIYPNPTQDVLHVVHNEKSGYLYVTDVRGKLVQRIAVDPSGHSHVAMRQYPAGTYSIRHSANNEKDVASTFTVTR